MSKITDKDYAFVEKPSSLMYGVKIKTGKYKDVVVTYGKVSLSSEGGFARLNFQYNIDVAAGHKAKKLEKSDEFRNTLGDILSHIIQSSMTDGQFKIGQPASKFTAQAKHVIESPSDYSSEDSSR